VIASKVSAAQPARIPCAVPALVVGEDAVAQVGIEQGEGRDDVGAELRMGGDLPALLGGERMAVVRDVEQRLVHLADVVEQRHALDARPVALGEAARIGEDERDRGDAADVRPSGRVVRVDRVEERLQRGGGKPLDAAALTACLEPIETRPGGEQRGAYV
jgi:hypothetical protein